MSINGAYTFGMNNVLRAQAVCVRAVSLMGGPRGMAKAIRAAGCPISEQAVAVWKRIPPERCAIVHRITGIPIVELRPDLVQAAENADAE